MKTKLFYYLLLLLPLGFISVACDDDDNAIPDVGIQATISGGVFYNDEIYVVQGQVLTLDAIQLINNTKNEGTLGAVTYYWDHYLIGTNITQPFSLELNTAEQPVGRHLLQAQMPIYVVDYSICWGFFQYYVNIVASDADMPGDASTGDGSTTTPTSKIVNGIIKAKE